MEKKIDHVSTKINAQFLKSLRKMIRHQARTDEDTDDILQIVVLKILKNGNNVTPAKFITWLHVVCKTSSIDFYRKKNKSIEINENHYFQLTTEKDETDNSIEQLSKCIHPILKRLKPEEANVLSIVEFSGKSQKDAALQLGITYSTFKSKIQRARIKLKEEILACCELETDHRGSILEIKKSKKNCSC